MIRHHRLEAMAAMGGSQHDIATAAANATAAFKKHGAETNVDNSNSEQASSLTRLGESRMTTEAGDRSTPTHPRTGASELAKTLDIKPNDGTSSVELAPVAEVALMPSGAATMESAMDASAGLEDPFYRDQEVRAAFQVGVGAVSILPLCQ